MSQSLDALAAADGLKAALVLDSRGHVMARYEARVRAGEKITPNSEVTRSTAPLNVAGRAVGTLVLLGKPVLLGAILPRYLAVCGALFFAATGLALFMGRWLAGRVVDPVNGLSKTMRDVADSGD